MKLNEVTEKLDEETNLTRGGLWLMMAGCCLSLPLALVVLSLTGTSLTDSQPAFVAILAICAAALAAIGIRSHLKSGCHQSES